MAWANTGVLWSFSSDFINSRALDQKMKLPKGVFQFVQTPSAKARPRKTSNRVTVVETEALTTLLSAGVLSGAGTSKCQEHRQRQGRRDNSAYSRYCFIFN